MKYHSFLILITILFLSGCSSLPDYSGAAEEVSWEISYQLREQSRAVLAIGDLDTEGVPESLKSLFLDDLTTYLVSAFKDYDLDIQVVTRDRVDKIMKEQVLDQSGMTHRDTQLQVGMLLGADLMVTGTLAWLEDDIFQFSGMVIEVESGVVVGGYSRDFWFDMESPE